MFDPFGEDAALLALSAFLSLFHSRNMQEKNVRLTEVAALVDDLFARERLLVSNGLNSFMPVLRFTEAFSESPEEWKEYRDFVIGAEKRYIARDPEFDVWFGRQKQAAQQRYETTGDTSELKLTNLDKRWWRQQAKGRRQTFEILRPYKEEAARLWTAEVGAHASNLSGEFEAKGNSRMALYKAIMEQERTRTGLNIDRELSTSRSPVYSLTVGRDWKVCLQLDQVALAKPDFGPSRDVDTGEVFPGGVQFELYMEIRRRAENGGKSTRIAPVLFDWLFPVGVGLFGPRSYSRFSSFQELEAVIRIHLKMFVLIRPELEAALLAVSGRLSQ